MRLIALFFATGTIVWFLAGIAITTLIVYGEFDDVAIGAPAMAAILAAGATFCTFLNLMMTAALAKRGR